MSILIRENFEAGKGENEMGLYIPNVRKPKKCGQCPCAYFADGALGDICQITGDDIDDVDELLKNCPMQEIDDIQHKAFIEFSKLLLQRIEENLLRGEMRNE